MLFSKLTIITQETIFLMIILKKGGFQLIFYFKILILMPTLKYLFYYLQKYCSFFCKLFVYYNINGFLGIKNKLVTYELHPYLDSSPLYTQGYNHMESTQNAVCRHLGIFGKIDFHLSDIAYLNCNTVDNSPQYGELHLNCNRKGALWFGFDNHIFPCTNPKASN